MVCCKSIGWCTSFSCRNTKPLVMSEVQGLAEFPLKTAPPGAAPGREPVRTPGWATLLELFYAKLGLPLPPLGDVAGEEMPQPYKGLLVHSTDMTPTLEAFYKQPMRLSVLTREQQDYSYLREVVLKSANDSQPVE